MDVHERAENNWLEADQEPKNNNSWGMFSYGDAPAGIGGGIGSFVWFKDRDSLLDFIAQTLPFSPPGPITTELQPVIEATEKTVTTLKKGGSLEAGIEELNQTLRSFSQIRWIGTFEDLRTGQKEFEKEVRLDFRDSTDSSKNAKAEIEDNALKDFIEYIETYGI
ncbi:hypothetical protein [Pseudemcibacter aquimaris]|jgi:negative regulator of genetic competence, sporulation and motility|uniref:hypothetical protein n=1 Tax=Pseudemcibacter aquimaris TaxID=2857064 RepID=UPI0020115CE8|nr:hypothetical protein [Pseudemcibacter aquimaris]MCC3861778.1 hypothetical protein [Pseudemcibacter aquimaris]WDU57891.1 hypothetical protein KW060_11850 [Pseudemcibacter aquimaris]